MELLGWTVVAAAAVIVIAFVRYAGAGMAAARRWGFDRIETECFCNLRSFVSNSSGTLLKADEQNTLAMIVKALPREVVEGVANGTMAPAKALEIAERIAS